MPNPVVHFEIVGKDQKVLDAFYKAVFDWQLTPVMPIYSMVAKEEGGIGGGIGAFVDTPDYVTVYVEVQDFAATVARIESSGGKKLFGPHQLPDGTGVIGMFTDPEGHTLGLIQHTTKN
jgi:predicted enzyme related to lactoylglutathione lyase